MDIPIWFHVWIIWCYVVHSFENNTCKCKWICVRSLQTDSIMQTCIYTSRVLFFALWFSSVYVTTHFSIVQVVFSVRALRTTGLLREMCWGCGISWNRIAMASQTLRLCENYCLILQSVILAQRLWAIESIKPTCCFLLQCSLNMFLGFHPARCEMLAIFAYAGISYL